MKDKVKAEFGPELDTYGIEWDVFVGPGSPADVLTEASARFQGQLIVTGVARNEMFGRARPGGTIEALLKCAPTPVLTIKRRGLAPYRTVLVPTDFTEVAETALMSALRMFPDARFVLLHGYRVPFAGILGEEAHALEFHEEALGRQRIFAQRIQAQLHGRESPETLVEYGSPEVLIADYESVERPDLIVIGAHDRRDWLRNAATGKAAKIISAAHCDVLIVPESLGAAFHAHHK